MWARIVEFMLGCWVAIGPFIFQHADGSFFWATDFLFAAAICSLALVSYWHPMRHAHLGIGLVAGAMIAVGRLAGDAPPGPAHQSYIVVGLLLLMFCIVPNQASQPPLTWSRQEPVTS